MLTAQLRPVAPSISWVRLSAENEVRIGGINSENVSEDVHLGQVCDEHTGFDTGEKVGTFLIPEPPTQSQFHEVRSMTEIKAPTQSPQDRMMEEVVNGADDGKSMNFSAKTILARGCDPQMARRASTVMPTLLGGVQLVSCTNDDDFVAKLRERAWSVVFFAPGACRYSAARMPIPGGRAHTMGWGLEEYRALVRQYQGDQIPIVETTNEREIVPRLRQALLQSSDKTTQDE
jgi:hypothetical protein